jgi:hypothetical protein
LAHKERQPRLTEDERHHLQEWAKRQLAIYLLRNPHTEQVYEDLLANADAWRMGFYEEDFYVWVAPMTADGRSLPMPFNVLKCDWHDFQAIRAARS